MIENVGHSNRCCFHISNWKRGKREHVPFHHEYEPSETNRRSPWPTIFLVNWMKWISMRKEHLKRQKSYLSTCKLYAFVCLGKWGRRMWVLKYFPSFSLWTNANKICWQIKNKVKKKKIIFFPFKKFCSINSFQFVLRSYINVEEASSRFCLWGNCYLLLWIV